MGGLCSNRVDLNSPGLGFLHLGYHHLQLREHVMVEKEYAKPVWSYADSMGPAIHYGHTPEFNGLSSHNEITYPFRGIHWAADLRRCQHQQICCFIPAPYPSVQGTSDPNPRLVGRHVSWVCGVGESG